MNRKWQVLGLLAIALGVFAINSKVPGPWIQLDEGSYLTNAAALAGYPNDFASSYHSGYSLLIAPAFWLADAPGSIWIAVKAINSLLFTLTVVGLWLLARQLSPTASDRKRLAAVAIVSIYPMWLGLSGYALAQVAFVPVFLFTLLAYVYAISGGLSAWAGLGLLAGFLYWVHPTGAAPIIAVIAGSAYISLIRRNIAPFSVTSFSAISMVLIYQYGVTPWLHERMNISGLSPELHYPGLTQFFSPLMSIRGIRDVLVHVSGQVFYLSIGTVGLFWLGTWELVKQSSRAGNHEAGFKYRAIAVFLCLSSIGIIGLAALLFSSISELAAILDHWMYGRYVEGVIAPVLLIGALAVSHRNVLWAIPVAAICACFLAFELESYTHVPAFHIPAFWQAFWLADLGLWWWLASGCALIVLVALMSGRTAMIGVALVFACSSYLQIAWHNVGAEGSMWRWKVALKIREEYPPGTCVAFDYSGVDNYFKSIFWYDFGFVLYDYELKKMSIVDWLDSCDGPIIGYRDGFQEQGISAYSLATSQHGGPTAWVKGRPPADFSPISWSGEPGLPSQVGYHNGLGMMTDGRAGFLVYGPYEPVPAGTYTFTLTGDVASNGERVVVDVIYNEKGKVYARFEGLNAKQDSESRWLLNEELTLDEDVAELEVRVRVEPDVDLFIDGYGLKLVRSGSVSE